MKNIILYLITYFALLGGLIIARMNGNIDILIFIGFMCVNGILFIKE